ncbi:MAG: ribosome biogenesis GTPase Der [Peptococcaceae bacterium]|jgi:GTP-binding protein|nr:ribosome biogenesis GTPase Der [Peptococcaceae bacterium]
MPAKDPVVAIVGRPNVGKSTLFNRLSVRRAAIVEKEPGVTRDRLYLPVEWAGRTFTLVDTGGMDIGAPQEIARAILRQAALAVEEARVLLFVVDARTGLTPADEEVAAVLRRSGKPVILVANKVERFDPPPPLAEFYRLGLGEALPVSAAEGLNTGDLLDRILELVPAAPLAQSGEGLAVAVVGRPNAGKSSLVNALLGEERVIVCDWPGTTRDAVDTLLVAGDRRYLLIDTAGLRKRGKISGPLERYSVSRALGAVDRCRVALLVMDALQGVTEQDKRIAGYVLEQGKALVVVVNKWDLAREQGRPVEAFREHLAAELPFVGFAPSVFLSARTGRHLRELWPVVDKVAANYARRLSTNELNRLVREAVLQNPPPASHGHRLKINFATQSKSPPPTFVLFVNDPELAHFSYLRHLENELRKRWDFTGTPVRIVCRKRSAPGGTRGGGAV